MSASTLRDVNPDTLGDDLAVASTDLVRRLGAPPLATTADLEQAVLDRDQIGAVMKRVEAYFAPLKKMAYDLHRAICDREGAILKPLKAHDADRAGAIRDYKARVDRERDEQQRQLAEQARRDAEARAALEAAALEAAGQPELAAAVVDEAIARPAPVVSVPDPTRGIAKFRRRWCWRYAGGPADVAMTPAAVVQRTLAILPREYLTVDESKVGAYARAMKGAGKIPGIEIYSVDDPVR